LTIPFTYITICKINAKTHYGSNDIITTARLPVDTRNKLLALSRAKNMTKSEIIIESLEFYYKQEESDIDSYTLGEKVFGRYGSGESDRSVTYKQRIKEKLSGRMNAC
jgi:predicted DNA-binding protein